MGNVTGQKTEVLKRLRNDEHIEFHRKMLRQMEGIVTDLPSLQFYWNIYITIFDLEEMIYKRSTKKVRSREITVETGLGSMKTIRPQVDTAYYNLFKDIQTLNSYITKGAAMA
ncbi:hypothetical protein FACS189414_1890 [Bacteroidia bacterium]|nr:hypothetical protein AGMMS49574_17380 [Bacteroidia bacterium]GHU76263.1 hypothetical protein FACS189414_1890 [Bacteroidia bacterium]